MVRGFLLSKTQETLVQCWKFLAYLRNLPWPRHIMGSLMIGLEHNMKINLAQEKQLSSSMFNLGLRAVLRFGTLLLLVMVAFTRVLSFIVKTCELFNSRYQTWYRTHTPRHHVPAPCVMGGYLTRNS